MPVLKPAIKRFIVMELARHEGLTVTRDSVKKNFDLEVSLSQIQAYDPTSYQGRELSKELRTLFETTRAKFLDDLEAQPLAHKAVRLKKLNKIHDEAMAKGVHRNALGAIDQARKEMDGLDWAEPEDEGEWK